MHWQHNVTVRVQSFQTIWNRTFGSVCNFLSSPQTHFSIPLAIIFRVESHFVHRSFDSNVHAIRLIGHHRCTRFYLHFHRFLTCLSVITGVFTFVAPRAVFSSLLKVFNFDCSSRGNTLFVIKNNAIVKRWYNFESFAIKVIVQRGVLTSLHCTASCLCLLN